MSNSSESLFSAPLLGGLSPNPLAYGSRNPYSLFSKRADEVFRSAHRDRVLLEMTPRTGLSKAMEGNGVTVDVLSLGRNSANGFATIAGAAGKVAGAVGGLAIAGGAMGVAGGLNGMRNAGIRLSKDYETGNWEGGAVNSLSMMASGGYATVSGSMVVTNAATFAGAAGTTAAAGSAITVAGIGMYGLIGIIAGYGIGVNVAFRRELNGISGENDERLADAILWLAGQVRGDTIHTTLEKKWSRFAFRSSEAACRMVRDKATPELLARLEQNDPAAIAEAKAIIREVKRENSKQILKHSIMMAIAVIGIAAFVCGLVYATGPFAPLLFAFGAILWILVDSSHVHEALGNRLFGKSEIAAPTVPKLSAPSCPVQSTGSAIGTGAAVMPAPFFSASNPVIHKIEDGQAEAKKHEDLWNFFRATWEAGKKAAKAASDAIDWIRSK